MAKKILKWLLYLIVIAAVATALLHIPGYGQISWQNYSITAPLWLIIVGLIVLIVLLSGLKKICVYAWHLPSNIRGLFAKRTRRKQQQQLELALSAWLQHNWPLAALTFGRLAKTGHHQCLANLMAANAYRKIGQTAKQCDHLNQAGACCHDQTTLAMVQADAYIAAGNTSQAEILLQSLPHSDPATLRLLAIAEQKQHWEQVLMHLDQLAKSKILSETEKKRKAITAATGLLISSHNSESCLNCWQQLAKNLKAEREVLASYAKTMQLLGQGQAVEQLLRQQLEQDWDQKLFIIYALLYPTLKPHKQTAMAVKWQQKIQSSADSLLAAAILYFRQGEHHTANQYLKRSLANRRSIAGEYLHHISTDKIVDDKQSILFCADFLLKNL